MIFGKKRKNKTKCNSCNSSINGKYSFCPYCGNSLTDPEKESRDFGMLGKTDSEEDFIESFGITDKLINSLVNNLAKSLDKQFRDIDEETSKEMNRTEIRSLPRGISIRIGAPKQQMQRLQGKKARKEITESQIKKMSSLPKATAKTSVKRINDKVIYELNTPGVSSAEDVFVSKLESGYEIKAIGDKKVYINNIPINLPLKNLGLMKNKLLVEFISSQ